MKIIKYINTLSFRSRSTVAKNFYFLGILQATNYVFPLITIPYVTRIFGPEVFGLLNFASSLIGYLGLIINFGFDLSASREIAQNRDNTEKVNKILVKVIFSKLLLFIVCSLVFILLLLFVNKISEYKYLYLILFFGGFFNIFLPTWYFQGIEKMKYTAIFTFIVRLIFTLSVFVLVKDKEDYLYYPIATIIGQVIVSAFAMYTIVNVFKMKIFIPKGLDLINTLKSGLRIFITTIIINLYTTTNIVILGFITSTYEVGIFSAAHKIIIIFMSMISAPLGQALYPNIGYAFSQSHEEGMKKIFKALIVIIPITLIPSLIIYAFPGPMVNLLFGEMFTNSTVSLRIMSFLPFIIALSNVFGIQGLLNLKKDNAVIYITFIGAIVGLTSNMILVPLQKQTGTAISWVLTESVITALMFVVFLKNTNFMSYTKKYLVKIKMLSMDNRNV